jgi:hypothetical protein
MTPPQRYLVTPPATESLTKRPNRDSFWASLRPQIVTSRSPCTIEAGAWMTDLRCRRPNERNGANVDADE